MVRRAAGGEEQVMGGGSGDQVLKSEEKSQTSVAIGAYPGAHCHGDKRNVPRVNCALMGPARTLQRDNHPFWGILGELPGGGES